MKGTWVYDEKGDVWHLVWQRNHPNGSHRTGSAWCGKVLSTDAPEKHGSQITFMDIVHDECLRKSEELA